jgi:hypothetical protein
MINETIQAASLMVNGSIPLSVTVNTATNWTQYIFSAFITLFASFGLILILYFPQIVKSMKGGTLRTLSKITGNNLVMIKHTKQALFSQSMINQETLRDLSEVMNKMGGKDFDLILHTPGGDVFSSLACSRLIKQYPGRIRAIVPLYSMSGGSLLALSCKELLMGANACLGPIDPQLGGLFTYGSARNWSEIVKFKGKKAEDQSISFAMTGKQYTKSIAAHLHKIIDFGLNTQQKGKLITFMTDGSIEHAYPLTITDLNNFGIPTYTLNNPKFLKALAKILSSSGKEGVTYYKIGETIWNR